MPFDNDFESRAILNKCCFSPIVRTTELPTDINFADSASTEKSRVLSPSRAFRKLAEITFVNDAIKMSLS
jgi:hypothetical protein